MRGGGRGKQDVRFMQEDVNFREEKRNMLGIKKKMPSSTFFLRGETFHIFLPFDLRKCFFCLSYYFFLYIFFYINYVFHLCSLSYIKI